MRSQFPARSFQPAYFESSFPRSGVSLNVLIHFPPSITRNLRSRSGRAQRTSRRIIPEGEASIRYPRCHYVTYYNSPIHWSSSGTVSERDALSDGRSSRTLFCASSPEVDALRIARSVIIRHLILLFYYLRIYICIYLFCLHFSSYLKVEIRRSSISLSFARAATLVELVSGLSPTKSEIAKFTIEIRHTRAITWSFIVVLNSSYSQLTTSVLVIMQPACYIKHAGV